MIKKALKYGVTFGAGALVGAAAVVPDHTDQEPDEKMWEGNTMTIRMGRETAERLHHAVDHAKEMSAHPEGPFVEDDLTKLRTELSHSLGDLSDDEQFIEIEVSDRQRLRLYETIIADPLKTPSEDWGGEEDGIR